MNRKKILKQLSFLLGLCFIAFTAVTSLEMLIGFGLGVGYVSFVGFKLYNKSLK